MTEKPYIFKRGEPLPEGAYEISPAQKEYARNVMTMATVLAEGEVQKLLIILQAALAFAVARHARRDKIDAVLNVVTKNVEMRARMIIEQTPDEGEKMQ